MEPRRVSPAAPPWLWFWSVLFLINLPRVFGGDWTSTVEEIAMVRRSIENTRVIDPAAARLLFLLYPATLLNILPDVALFAGIAAVLFPWLRARIVERRYGLAAPAAPTPAVTEISAFVAERAPALAIKINALRSDATALVYPSGYGRATLALFAPILKMWCGNRAAAEATLLHELAHYRRGDAQIIGAGSLFEPLLRYTLLYYLLFVAVPFLILIADRLIRSRASFEALGMESGTILSHQLDQLTRLDVPGLLNLSLAFLCTLLRPLVLPVAAIWSAELNADRLVLDELGTPGGVSRALEMRVRPVPWWQWLLFRLSHPPTSLRKWMLAHPGRGGLAVLLLLFPLAYLPRVLVQVGEVVFQLRAVRFPAEQAWVVLRESLGYVPAALFGIWVLLVALLVLWPLVAGAWERLFTARRQSVGGSYDPAYGLSAGAVVVVGMLAGALLRPAVPTALPETAAVVAAPDPATPGQTAPPATATRPVVGETAALGPLRVALLGVRSLAPVPGLTPDEGNHFVAVEYAIENTGRENAPLFPASQFSMKDDEGRTFALEPAAMVAAGVEELPSGPIAPGATLRGLAGYQVPTSATSLQWLVEDGEGRQVVFAFDAPAAVPAAGATEAPETSVPDGPALRVSPAPAAPPPSATLGDWRLTVNEAWETTVSGRWEPEAGNKFVLLDITVENLGAEAASFSTLLQLWLTDESGERYEVDVTAAMDAGERPEGTVPAGDRVRGVVGYQVPLEARDYELLFKEVLGDANVVIPVEAVAGSE